MEVDNLKMEKIYRIIDEMKNKNEGLIPILQKSQDKLGYLPVDVLKTISEKMNLPYHQVFGVATFYSQFRLKPQGEIIIHSCDGTACHVRGSKRIREAIEREYEIKKGETTTDGKFTLKIVRCVGCCSLAPVVVVGEDTYGRMDSKKVSKILKKYKE